jgi:hypothetical protein
MSQLQINATKNVIIEGGNFSTAGNFSGYDAETSERYFIPGRMMKAKGWATDAEVPTVFFAVLTNKQYNVLTDELDAEGNRVPEIDKETGEIKTFTRLTVTKIYKSKEEHGDAIEAVASYHGYLEHRATQAKASISVVSTKKADSVANAPV